MWPNPQKTADLVKFTEEIRRGTNSKIWVFFEGKELFRWNKKYFSQFLSAFCQLNMKIADNQNNVVNKTESQYLILKKYWDFIRVI